MSLSARVLDGLRRHWAVQAIPRADLNRSEGIVNERLAKRLVGDGFEFPPEESRTDDALLGRVALAYRIALIEGLDALSTDSAEDQELRERASAGAYCAFGILRLLPPPEDTFARVFHVFEISALACIGERWTDLSQWFMENERALQSPDVDSQPWDRRLLYTIFDCWIRIFRKDGREDLSEIESSIAGLRRDQNSHEGRFLGIGAQTANRSNAFRLAAFYHWARATELLAMYLARGYPPTILTEVDGHFKFGIRTAGASGDRQLEMTLRCLHPAARIIGRKLTLVNKAFD